MAQCVIELFGLDLHVAYEHAFVYIRQLAIQLRSALVHLKLYTLHPTPCTLTLNPEPCTLNTVP